jgi:hypothetical protein
LPPFISTAGITSISNLPYERLNFPKFAIQY